MKQRATSYLIHAGVPLKLWYWACTQAAYMCRAKVLGLKLPSDAPTFGNRVLVRDPKAEDKSFTKRTKEAIFLCWDTSVIQGAYAMTTNGGRLPYNGGSVGPETMAETGLQGGVAP